MKAKPAMIRLATDLDSYFEDEIKDTARKQGLQLSPLSSSYLARMLTRFSDARSYLNSNGSDETTQRSLPRLAMIWLEGLSSDAWGQYQKFQFLGDVALFTSGFFAERIPKTLVDMDYYRAMGGQAYERAGRLRESIQAERDLNVFFELSKSFSPLVEVMAEISDKSLLANDQDLLKLYEKWLRSGSDRIRRMLAENGILSSPEGN